VIDVGVDTPIGGESNEVETMVTDCMEGFLQVRVLSQLAFRNREIDAGKFLIDGTTSSEIEVADFRISHLSLGESDDEPAGLKAGAGVFTVETIVNRSVGEEGGVALLFSPSFTGGVDPPTITDQKENGLLH
jgi:hypothetical protein